MSRRGRGYHRMRNLSGLDSLGLLFVSGFILAIMHGIGNNSNQPKLYESTISGNIFLFGIFLLIMICIFIIL